MPYITQQAQTDMECGKSAETTGELNFAITMLVLDYVQSFGKSYTVLNDVMGVLESAKQEFYRRVVVPYETVKIYENGDVYYV